MEGFVGIRSTQSRAVEGELLGCCMFVKIIIRVVGEGPWGSRCGAIRAGRERGGAGAGGGGERTRIRRFEMIEMMRLRL